MSNINLEEKENEKHCTDRFIPSRKHSKIDANHPFSFMDEDQKLSLRGQEVKEEKLALD